jgi:amidase
MASQLMTTNGPLTRSVRDARLGFEVLAMYDPRDNRQIPGPLRLEPVRRPIKIALVTHSDGPPVQPAVWAAVRRAGAYLQAAGYCVEEVNPPELHAVSELWHALGMTESFYTLKPQLKTCGDPGIEQFMDAWLQLRPPRDLPGYLSALAERDAHIYRWQMFFQEYPLVVMPSSTERPIAAGIDVQGLAGARSMLDALYFQLTLPVLGIPGLAMPLGMDGDLPMGVQLVAGRFREDLLFDAAETIEAQQGVRGPIDPFA